MYTLREAIRRRDCVRDGALAVSISAGACLYALGAGSVQSVWLLWAGLFPLFVVVRACDYRGAGLYGGLWGLVQVILHAVGFTDTNLSLGSVCVLVAAPSFYSCLASRLTASIGYSPFVLGVGWMGVELALDQFGFSSARWVGTRGGVVVLHWVLNALGCVFGAFLAA
ncbi:MAG: hypothetical protein PVI86_19535, partial [Phycisphaerae bacterium]